MRVLLTVHEFFPDYAAGTEVLTLGVARGLRDRGHEVRILTGHPHTGQLADAERFDAYEYDGFAVARFRHDWVAMGGQRSAMELEHDNRLVARRFRALLAEFRPDIVHFFHLQRLSASPVDECVAAGVPTVFTPTDFWFMCPTVRLRLPDGADCDGPEPDSLNCVRHLASLTQPPAVRSVMAAVPDALLRPLVNAVCGTSVTAGPVEDIRALRRRREHLAPRVRQIDFILAPTRMIERVLLREGVSRERVGLHRYGVDAQSVARSRSAHSGTLVMGFIGTLATQKGAHVAIRAIRQLGPEVDVRLDLYGKLGEFPSYQRELDRLADGDPRIRFLGTFPNQQIGEVLAGIDLLVVPSTWRENTPLVLYSAQAAACPVIGSDVEGISEVIEHERNGLLFPAGDVTALASTIMRAASNRDLIASLSAAAVRAKSTAEYVDDVERVYDQVLAQRAAIE